MAFPSIHRTLPGPRRALTLALLAAMPDAHAQWAADFPELEFEVLKHFSTLHLDGAKEKAYPFIPPVAVQQDSQGWFLQGGTMYGAAQEDISRKYPIYGMSDGLSYRLDLDTAGAATRYQQWAVPTGIGWTNTDYTELGSGRFLANALPPPMGSKGDPQLVVLEKGQLSPWLPTGTDTYSGPNSATGQFARDPDGNIYLGESIAMGSTTNRSYSYPLIRINADGSREVIVDFASFLDPDSKAYIKGGAPTQLFWSTLDDSLYIGSLITIATASMHYPGVAPTETVTSVLSRISGTALRRGNIQADDIEVLHYFLKGSEGTIATNSSERLYSIVEDGDWLYGNALLGAGGSGLWRLNRKTPENGVGIILLTSVLDAVHGTDGSPPNLNGGPSGNNLGLLAKALDGNIYGTTLKDASVTSANSRGIISAQGKGLLYRLVPGTLPDRSDDKLEWVRYFNDDATSHTPYGLRAGPVIGNQQWLLGVTKDGTPATDCGTVCQAGALYALKITLPEVVFTQALQTDKTRYIIGDQPIISWATTGTQQCEAGGGWSGAQLTKDRIQLPALQAAGNVQYILTCTGPTGSKISETNITVTASDITQPVPPTEKQVVDGGGALTPSKLFGLFSLALLAGLRQRRLRRLRR
ncbi:hypothetical protein [Kerstersia sp.]|uniref:hypothetical protein n=1 Tax=Kerstersia sp. TaxID=1930783 RepID=UPI003F907C74